MRTYKQILQDIERATGIIETTEVDNDSSIEVSMSHAGRTIYVSENITEDLVYYDVLVELIYSGLKALDEYEDMSDDYSNGVF